MNYLQHNFIVFLFVRYKRRLTYTKPFKYSKQTG